MGSGALDWCAWAGQPSHPLNWDLPNLALLGSQKPPYMLRDSLYASILQVCCSASLLILADPAACCAPLNLGIGMINEMPVSYAINIVDIALFSNSVKCLFEVLTDSITSLLCYGRYDTYFLDRRPLSRNPHLNSLRLDNWIQCIPYYCLATGRLLFRCQYRAWRRKAALRLGMHRRSSPRHHS